jgi:hypothetical protein
LVWFWVRERLIVPFCINIKLKSWVRDMSFKISLKIKILSFNSNKFSSFDKNKMFSFNSNKISSFDKNKSIFVQFKQNFKFR